MRCHICDRALNDSEIKYNPDHDEYDPCGVCLDVIEDVFGEGDHLDEREIDYSLEHDENEEPIDGEEE